MLLLLTNSEDGTASQLLSFSDAVPVFRFNTDLWRDYYVVVTPDGWTIRDPIGRELNSSRCTAVYVRKPFAVRVSSEAPDELWATAQVQAVVHLWVNWARRHQRLVLPDPADEQRLDKAIQLELAALYFRTPETRICWGADATALFAPSTVAKTLAARGFKGGRFLFTRRLTEDQELDPRWPWYLQREHGGFDLTVLYVDGEIFASQLDRETFAGEDWRQHISSAHPLQWTHTTLSSQEESRVHLLMNRFAVRFGRLDFLREADGALVFLEINTNGEWGWLDEDGRRGIFAAVWRAIVQVHLKREYDAASSSLLTSQIMRKEGQ